MESKECNPTCNFIQWKYCYKSLFKTWSSSCANFWNQNYYKLNYPNCHKRGRPINLFKAYCSTYSIIFNTTRANRWWIFTSSTRFIASSTVLCGSIYETIWTCRKTLIIIENIATVHTITWVTLIFNKLIARLTRIITIKINQEICSYLVENIA